MKIATQKSVNNPTLIVEGIYLKAMPTQQLQAYFEGLQKSSESKDEKAAITAINDMFRDVIVDKNGKAFEDLVDSDATEVLPMADIQNIIESIGEVLTPNPK